MDNASKLNQPGIHRFTLHANGRDIPTTVWTPEVQLRGVILACHGGSGHKESGAILAIKDQFLKDGYLVAAIDGPVHGERRADKSTDSAVAIAAFREAWREGVGRYEIAEDFIQLLDEIQKNTTLAALPVGYIGVSMGTAYGLPLLAKEKRIQVAVLGLWGTNYIASEHLLESARDVQCSVWFTQQWHDQAFDRPGTHALFDAIGSEDKRLVAYVGPHIELQGERLEDAVSFLKKRLS